MKKIITLGFGVLMLAAALGLNVSAQTTSSSPTVEELQKQIQLLLGQLGSLQKEVASLKSGTAAPTIIAPATPTTLPPTTIPTTPTVIDESEVSGTEAEFIAPPTLTRSLFRGSRGDDVRQLQEFLSQDPTIYPEGLATGFYGAGTEAAVRKWQAKNGLPSVGVIGRQTIAKFKEIYSGVLGGLKQQGDRSDTSIFTRPTAPKPISPTPNACPVYVYMPVCKEGQSSYDANSCQVCQIKTDTTKKEICPALPTVDSCLAGEERVVTYKSAQCGVFYTCKPRSTPAAENNTYADIKPSTFGQETNRYSITLYDPDGIQKYSVLQANGAEVYFGYPGCRAEASSNILVLEKSSFPIKVVMADCRSGAKSSVELNAPTQTTTTTTGLIFPYKFSNGKIVYSSADARSYCYANGPGTGQGVASECETKFGIVYQTIITTTTSGQSCDSNLTALLGTGCHYMYNDSASNPIFCDNSMSKSAKKGDIATTAGCSGSTTTTTTAPAGQKEQTWNSLGLRSWIRTDADAARIEQLKSACISVSTGANIWLPNAGTSSSVDFGMPSADKCRLAASCTASQYFDGSACTSSTVTTGSAQCSDGRDNDSDGFIDYPSDTGCYSRDDNDETPGTSTTSTSDCSVKYGTGWHTMSDNNCYDSEMKNYRTTNGTLYSCSTTPTTGCSGTTSTTTTAQCSDGRDNDGDGFIDYPSDTGCYGPADTDETPNTTPTSSCPNSLLTSLLGSDCHFMYSTPTGNIYCDGPMSKSAREGETTTTSGCQAPTSSTQTTTTTTSTGSCSQYGSGWHTMGSDSTCFDTNMTSYRTANGTLYSCSATPTTGCSSSSSTTSSTACTSGQYWNGSACVSSTTTNTSCPSGEYWSGSNCVSSATTSATCTSGQYWNGSACVTSPTTSTSCPSGQYWNGTACVATITTNTSCPSGQYWNGTACVTTITTDCPSGQYWSGTACVSSTPSASVYDQMKNQLKSMEIILRGLLGR